MSQDLIQNIFGLTHFLKSKENLREGLISKFHFPLTPHPLPQKKETFLKTLAPMIKNSIFSSTPVQLIKNLAKAEHFWPLSCWINIFVVLVSLQLKIISAVLNARLNDMINPMWVVGGLLVLEPPPRNKWLSDMRPYVAIYKLDLHDNWDQLG